MSGEVATTWPRRILFKSIRSCLDVGTVGMLTYLPAFRGLFGMSPLAVLAVLAVLAIKPPNSLTGCRQPGIDS